MKHTDKVKNYHGSHDKLAEEIGDLYYDALADLLKLLSEKIATDAQADSDRGRKKLARHLFSCSNSLQEAAGAIDGAWEICKPYAVKEVMLMKKSPLDVLQEMDTDILTEIIKQLNNDGIILDEDRPSFSSTVMEAWDGACDDFLTSFGYHGGKLMVTGHYYPNHGAVYALFDESIHDFEYARKIMDIHVENYSFS